MITFTLRNGVQWSDGTPITAQQVVESWLHHLAPETASEYAYMMAEVVKGAADYNEGHGPASGVAIRAVNDRTFEVTMNGPTPYALDMMAHYAFSPLPMHVINRYGSNWTRVENFVGNGPFILSEYIPNNRIVVTPNDKYWNSANVFLTKITFLPIEDQNTSYNAFLNGEIDWDTGVPLARIDEVKLHKDYQVAPQAGTYYILINHVDYAPLRDARVRKALAMAINRQELIDNVVKGGQLPANSLVPSMGDYVATPGNPYNVAEAQRLLAEAGYPGGAGLPTFEYVYNTLDSHRIIGEYIQQALRNNLGVNITLRNMEWASYLDYRDTPSMQLARAGWIADYMDPQNLLDLLISNTGNNDGRYSNAEYDRLIRQATVMPAGAARNAIMRQAEDIAITQDQALIPIYFYVSQSMIDLSKWDGWYPNVMDTHPYVGMKKK
uniref:Oligopeptide ABC transporter, periplasmic oligopeptide-binding protein OppA (TC 3.A.1.5.1) n=1 Tax=uncultured bacterium contig00066 TaxID=1181548 RepID=A0A806KFN5_9BACT|nr:oligopeptide ABC transporter, periplasmic oligopeptide-binding protein OppA (TC 3.A.1.5.1) [uncultured bacterium contig00066]